MSEKATDEEREPKVKKLEKEASGREKAEEKLLETERKLADTQRMAHTGSWVWDSHTGEVEWSDETYRIFGLNRQYFHPQIDSIMGQFHPDDRKLHENLIEQITETHEQYTFEAKILTPDGSTRYLISNSEGNFDKNGRLFRISGIVMDITDQKQTENMLRKSEEKYRLLADNVTDVIFVLDISDLQILFVDDEPALVNIGNKCLNP